MQGMLWSYLVVAFGGALGAISRFAISGWLYNTKVGIPAGTLSSNLLGCLIMGIIAQLATSASWFNDAGIFPEHYRLLFAVGFCGSFTTLSALIFELNEMMQRAAYVMAFGYMMLTLIGGFVCFLLGALGVRVFFESQS